MAPKYQIVVDESMPGVAELFDSLANIVKVNGREISNQTLVDNNADALLCRSITPVNQSLLENTQVKFIGTATIGTDHLDIDWLDENGISWSNAAGCNAAAVAQYVVSGMSYWCLAHNKNLKELTVGIIGAGNVGSELSRCLSVLGVKSLLCDPPLEAARDKRHFVDFQTATQCDVVTFHVPLISEGKYQTRYMLGAQELALMGNHQLLINASRGAIINNCELEKYLLSENAAQVILDVFENEPNISSQLLSSCLLATPHIAGHTLEGKLRGTWMIYQAFCQNFAIDLSHKESVLYPAKNSMVQSEPNLENMLLQIYGIQLDSDALRSKAVGSIGDHFDQLRKNAIRLSNGIVRRDYSGWSLPHQIIGLAQ